MSKLRLWHATFFAVLRLCDSGQVSDPLPAVLNVDDDNMNKTTEKFEHVLLEFVDPDCKMCKEVDPLLEAVAIELHSQMPSVAIAKYDISKQNKTASHFQVKGTPTFIYVHRGKLAKVYLGRPQWMTEEGLTHWISKRQAATEHVPEIKLDEPGPDGNDDQVILVARVKNASKRQAIAWNATQALANIDAFNLTLVAQWLPETSNATEDAKLQLRRPYWNDVDPVEVEYDGKWNEEDIVDWVVKHAYPSIGAAYTPERYGHYAMHETRTPFVAVLLINDTAADHTDQVAVRVEEAVRPLVPSLSKYQNYLFTFAHVSKLSGDDLDVISGGSNATDVLVSVLSGRYRFLLETLQKVTDPDELEEFLKWVPDGRVKPTFKSAPLPDAELDDLGVRILVGSNFHEHVIRPKKDVVVFFTARDDVCSGCLKMEEEWSKLAEKSQQNKWPARKIILATLDMETNEWPDVQLDELPKLILYPAVPSEMKLRRRAVYEGPPNLGKMVAFLVQRGRNFNDDDLEPGHEEL